MAPASEITLNLQARSRVDLINVSEMVEDTLRDRRWSVYYSYHTTAGYLDPDAAAKFRHDSRQVTAYLRSVQRMFPPDAGYYHDRLQLRHELDEATRLQEPRNADAHLTYIACGLSNCVTYANPGVAPVFFVELDGVGPAGSRTRRTSIVGYDREVTIQRFPITVPVSGHLIDSVNLKDPQLGLFAQIQEAVRRLGLLHGRIDITLEPSEEHAGLTVNEYETLLMQYDLAEVLRNPLRFVAQRSRHMLEDPLAIPRKAKGYAKFDFVHLLNETLDTFQLSGTLVERLLSKFMAYPAARSLRMKRSLSLLVTADGRNDFGHIVEGTYQSPILIQWGRPDRQRRRLQVSVVTFE
ncbi:MAG TPA: hypothetical protein P5568_08770 [Acidobacteriota bacterium]|nr:hypothetical protein [Acidobacteriota bacterium]HRV08548.1 hypothetical protein [Acidobacteriota bacterium]